MSVIHGENRVTLEGDTIFITLKGSFNEYGMQLWFESVRSIVNDLNSKPFYILMNFLEIDGGTPEAYKVSDQFNIWLNGQNMIAKACVAPPVLIAIDELQINKTLRKNQNFKYFNILGDALLWLKSQNKISV